jgi:hypothetical protein
MHVPIKLSVILFSENSRRRKPWFPTAICQPGADAISAWLAAAPSAR